MYEWYFYATVIPGAVVLGNSVVLVQGGTTIGGSEATTASSVQY